jgi:dihydropteroate synthase
MLKNVWKISDKIQLNTLSFKVMGVVNITDDSFYSKSRCKDIDTAVKTALRMAEEGADIIDVGGESTRPGSCRTPIEEEIKKVVPLIKLLSENLDIPISCDTYKAEVAEKAIEAGASIINDISAFSLDQNLLSVVKSTKCGYILMHMQGTPDNMQTTPYYNDVIKEILEFFEKKLNFMQDKGISPEKVVIDPGIGFGKRLEDNLKLIKQLDRFQKLGRPICVGTSRKSFIGKILNGVGTEERLEGSLASMVVAYIGGGRIFRTHDVKESVRVLRVTESILF